MAAALCRFCFPAGAIPIPRRGAGGPRADPGEGGWDDGPFRGKYRHAPAPPPAPRCGLPRPLLAAAGPKERPKSPGGAWSCQDEPSTAPTPLACPTFLAGQRCNAGTPAAPLHVPRRPSRRELQRFGVRLPDHPAREATPGSDVPCAFLSREICCCEFAKPTETFPSSGLLTCLHRAWRLPRPFSGAPWEQRGGSGRRLLGRSGSLRGGELEERLTPGRETAAKAAGWQTSVGPPVPSGDGRQSGASTGAPVLGANNRAGGPGRRPRLIRDSSSSKQASSRGRGASASLS